MYYDEYGDRKSKTVVLLHGAAATDTFANQYCLSGRYHLVVPHLYGSGREVETPYAPQKTLEALEALISSLGKEKVALVGHSLGGELAVALAARHPELFDRAAFLSAWICASDKSIKRYTAAARYTCVTLKWSWLVRLQGKYWGYTDAQAAFMADYARKIPPESYADWFRLRIRLDDYPQYGSVKLPMLAVCGDREVTEMKNSIAELGRRNPNCRTVLLRGANHDFPMRKTAETNALLKQFLEE